MITIAGNDKSSTFNAAKWISLGMLQGIAADEIGNIYVSGSSTIAKISQLGFIEIVSGGIDTGYSNDSKVNSKYYSPKGLALTRIGNIIVADSGNNAVRIILP